MFRSQPFKGAFLVCILEEERLRILDTSARVVCVDLPWPAAEETLQHVLRPLPALPVILFVETAAQVLRFETFPKALSLGDFLRLRAARRNFIAKSSVLWGFQCALKRVSPSLSFGVPPSGEMKSFLKMIVASPPCLKDIYSLSLERAVVSKSFALQQGISFREKTLTLLIQVTAQEIRHFIFFHEELIFLRTLKTIGPPLEKEALLKEGQETATYVRKLRNLPPEKTGVVLLEKACSEEAEIWRFWDTWRHAKPSLVGALKIVPLVDRERRMHWYQGFSLLLGVLTVAEGWGWYQTRGEGIALHDHARMVERREQEALHKLQSVPVSARQRRHVFEKYIQAGPSPLDSFKKIALSLGPSLRLRKASWQLLSRGRQGLTLEVYGLAEDEETPALVEGFLCRLNQNFEGATEVTSEITPAHTWKVKFSWAF